MSAIDLTTLTADAFADNPARVQDLLDTAAAMDDSVPVVMLPVRIETRFARVPAPVAVPVTLTDLARCLSEAATPLGQIAATDLTEPPAPVPSPQNRKERREPASEMYDRVAAQLGSADTALGACDLLLRQHLDGDPAPVVAGAAALRSGLEGAARSIARLRSDWQRGRLQAQLAAVDAHAQSTLGVIENSALPAAELRAALAPAAAAPTAGPAIPAGALSAGAATFKWLLAGAENLGAAPAATPDLAAAATTIPLLPAAYKQRLLVAISAAQARGTVPAGELATLATAVDGIRTDAGATVPAAQPTLLVDQLHVRIYPDDIAVDTHEEALTEAERDAGAAYWHARAAAGGDEAAQRAAWRALCAGRGSGRAAWIARLTEPPEPDPAAGVELAEEIMAALATFERRVEEVSQAAPGTRTPALVRAAQALDDVLATRRVIPQGAIDRARERWTGLRASVARLEAEAERFGPAGDPAAAEARAQLDQLLVHSDNELERLRPSHPQPPKTPEVELKEGAWTRAARSGVLPERFLVVAVAGGRVAHAVAGRPVPADLKLSIDPAPSDPAAEEFKLDENGDLVVGESIRWMMDYDEALAKGMAVTLPISETEALGGFARIYVIGLRPGDAADGAQRLAELLDNHHYGRAGLSLVPVGTPTNNTDKSSAGFRSTDDPDDSFPIEAAAALVDPGEQPAGDGLRAARALGVAPDTFAHVEHAGGRDAAEAQAATAALYPATIGSWLFDHLAGLVSADGRGRLSTFALAHVAARGLVPALRVGPQPYGLLPAMAYSRYVPDAAETVAAGAPASERDAQQRFDNLLAGVLIGAAGDWATIRDAHVAYATAPDVTDPRAHFLELLGLEAVSATAAYRFAVNVASRHSVASQDPGLQFGIPSSSPSADPTAAQYGPFALLERFRPQLATAFNVDPGAPLLDKGQLSDAYADVYRRVQDSRAYELRLLTGSHQLTGSLTGPDPAADVAALLAAAPAALAAQTRTDERHRSLLLLLARHARLVMLRDAALHALVAEGVLSEDDVILAGASTNFAVASLLSSETLTPWTYLFATLLDIDRRQALGISGSPLFTYLQNGQLTMADFLTGTGAAGVAGFRGGAYADVARRLADHAGALSQLAAVPAERLGLLVMEQLDVASHRLDAWITGLAHRRLTALRAATATPVGAYVAAYGWVENLRPDAGHPLAANVPAALEDPSRPVYADPQSEGFVHAPSVNHAVTAAILRGGYMSQRNEGDVENRMAVNLSSRRTRLACGLIDGVRAGNTLGALLGYRLERFLHDYHAGTGVTLDAVIGPLRKAFPSAAGVDAALNADAAALQVCDGLAITGTVLRWIEDNAAGRAAGLTVYDVLSFGQYTGYPWRLGTALPPLSDHDHLDGVVRAIDHVADALDALGDIVLAEGVHQLVMGNHARAAAVVSALGEGKAPPAPEVVETPRTGVTLTHRILLPLADAAGAPVGWEAVQMTPRAGAEPALNAWAARLIGAPGDIRLQLVEAASQLPAGEVTVADLGLHALDLVAILGPGLDTGLGEIATRALDARRPADLDDDTPPVPLQVDISSRAPTWGAGVRTLTEVAPLIEAIGALIGRARAATAQDWLLSEQGRAAARAWTWMSSVSG